MILDNEWPSEWDTTARRYERGDAGETLGLERDSGKTAILIITNIAPTSGRQKHISAKFRVTYGAIRKSVLRRIFYYEKIQKWAFRAQRTHCPELPGNAELRSSKNDARHPSGGQKRQNLHRHSPCCMGWKQVADFKDCSDFRPLR